MMRLNKGICHEFIPLQDMNTWRIGGVGRYVYRPENIDQLIYFLKNNHKKLPIVVLGLGSNVLLYDGPINAVFILLRNTLKHFKINYNESSMVVGCGMPCPTVARKAQKLGYTNLNFLAGIPGTIGGALKMNAGAFGGEIWPEVLEVTTVNHQGLMSVKKNSEVTYGYRSSNALNGDFFVEATLRLGYSNSHSENSVNALLQKRKSTQPVELASCGSVFKNPNDEFAAKLIDACGLKNYSIGDAVISPKHANFIINRGKATFDDVLNLMTYVYEQVNKKFGIELEPEVKIIGANGEYRGIW